MMLFGHGRSRHQPLINTIESFSWCVEQGAKGVEFDVRITADGQPVLHHDPALPNGRRVSATRRAELPAYVCGLDDVLALDLGVALNVEIKNYPGDPDWDPDQRVTRAVLDLLDQLDRPDDVIVSCFDFGAIDLVAAASPGLRTAMLYYEVSDPIRVLDDVVAHGHDLVHPYDAMVDTGFMAAAAAHDLGTNVWMGPFVPGRYGELVSLGVDGIITSDVARARASLDDI